MKAARVLRFGRPNVITNDDLPQPEPSAGQLLVRVKAAGVGHWDALIREGKVELQPLYLGAFLRPTFVVRTRRHQGGAGECRTTGTGSALVHAARAGGGLPLRHRLPVRVV